MWSIVLDILRDGCLAAVAALGFAAVSNPPTRSFVYVPILSAVGHMFRYILINYVGVEIAIATFVASLLIGFLGIYFAYKAHYPSEVFSFPALLPMIPGMYAYRSLLAMIKFMQEPDPLIRETFLPQFLSNGITACIIMLALGIGVAVPIFIFYKQSFKMTRCQCIDSFELSPFPRRVVFRPRERKSPQSKD